MQRFFVLIVLLSFSLPVGLSIAGCGHNTNNYCLKNGHAYGPTTNQVAYVTLQPETTGISLAWGQTQTVSQPQAFNCNNQTESVASYNYASSNYSLADISPSGTVCAGTWNRYSQGLAAPFTVCTPPTGASLANCGTSTSPNAACGVAQITATGASITSNPVNVYIHPPVTSLVIAANSPTQTGCISQDQTLSTTLLSQTLAYGADGSAIPAADLGTVTFTANNSSIVTINNTTNTTASSTSSSTTTPATNPNGTVTANQPGATVITASVAGSSSAAGYFYTCPPRSINLTINGQTTATVTPSSPPTINAVLTDKNGTTLSGTSLYFTSTQPQNLSVSSTGLVTANFPSTASISAICQPGSCNPAPIEQIGFYGTGTPVVSNTIQVNSPGRASDQVWMASTQSQFFSEVDLTTGTSGNPIRLPYVPNSMVADQGVNSLYFGSYRELMIYTATNNTLAKEDPSVPGVVLAVSPDNSTVVINDQVRQVIYLYSASAGTNTSIGGVATHARFSPDGTTVYITGPNALYVHNLSTGWSTYPISNSQSASCTPALNNVSTDPFCGRDLALMVPQVGPFVTGSSTNAYGFCPDTTVSPAVYYPQAASVPVETDHLGATPNGDHIIGASTTAVEDMWLYSDAAQSMPGPPTGSCPQPSATTSAGFTLYPFTVSTPLTGVTPSEITQVVPSPDSTVAFITYLASSGSDPLPAYKPATTANQPGTLTDIPLSGTAGAPIAGAFSPDGSLFFVSTQNDGLVHLISPTSLTDTGTISPGLTNSTQGKVAPQFIVVKSRTTT